MIRDQTTDVNKGSSVQAKVMARDNAKPRLGIQSHGQLSNERFV